MSGIVFGSTAAGYPWSTAALDARQLALGRKYGILAWYQWWKNPPSDPNGSMPNADLSFLQRTDANGSVPMITWEPWGGQGGAVVSFCDILNGVYDTYIDQWANTLKQFSPKKVLLRFAHEMNGNWYPWCIGQPGCPGPGLYKATYRYIVERFLAAGARNVKFVWTPNWDIGPSWLLDIAAVYPGDAYIDYVGTDVYADPADWRYLGNIGWRGTSNGKLEPIYQKIRSLTQRPFILAEVGAASSDVSAKSDWIRETYQYDIPSRFSDLAAFVWFDVGSYAMDTDGYSLQAMRDLANSMPGTL